MNKGLPYAVPDIPVKDIVSYFTELGVELTAAEVLRPTTLAAQRIYDGILQVFDGSCQQAQDESLQVIRLVQRMGLLLSRIGISNFTIRDLLPDSRRFIQILSSLVNFGMYRDSKQQIYEKVSRIADDNFAVKKEIEEKMKEIQMDINKAKVQAEEDDARKSALEDEIAGLEGELKKFYRYQKDKASEVALLKAERTEINDKFCSCQLIEHNLQQEIVCLKAQIVSDPSKLVELVKEMKELIEREKDAIRETERSMSECGARNQRVERMCDLLKKAKVMSDELVHLEEQLEEVSQSGVLQEGKLRNLDSGINALKIRINHVERQISHLESKVVHLQNKGKQYSEEISEKMAKLRIKYDDVTGEREKMIERVRCNNKVAQNLLREQMTLKSEFDSECSEIIASLVQLSSGIAKYFADINNCF